MSFFTRFSMDATNACQDLYSNWVLGDDAGKSARLTLILRPLTLPLHAPPPPSSPPHTQHQHRRTISTHETRRSGLDLGMTFLEINGRAYVKHVTVGSVAAQAGVLPQDAVQYATVFRQEWCHDHADEAAADVLATRHALDAEAKGLRIVYNDLRHLLAQAMDPTQSAFLSPPTTTNNSSSNNTMKHDGSNHYSSTWNGPPIPATVSVCVPLDADLGVDGYNYGMMMDGATTTTQQQQQQPRRPESPFSEHSPRPVVFVFRRTRQRKSIHHLGMPSFRLDDECDFAKALVQRLAPTADMETPPPDTWEELVHDGTDWLLGSGSMLPPKQKLPKIDDDDNNTNDNAFGRHQQQPGGSSSTNNNSNSNNNPASPPHHATTTTNATDDDPTIPYDDFERSRAKKLAQLRTRMAAEAMQFDRTDDVEAATIRGMIQKAVGLAFVRASKVVLGVSIHGGSGIVIARLSDGTWSAPSAIGTWGVGLGLQFGLEVAEYIFILQTQEALEHFRRNGSFTVGGNMGMAIAGLGREAYGAASVGNVCGSTSQVKDDEYNDNDSRDRHNQQQSMAVAPIVAYAKSQGLYVGVSLEGSRIFARDDINSRTYKFESGHNASAFDILSGKVPTPPEAEELYATLHSVEFTHEMSCLPRPPQVLRKDSANAWYYDAATLSEQAPLPKTPNNKTFSFFSTMTEEEAVECETFETHFKNFLYGGVSVQRLLPDANGRSGRTGKERRTLWLMLPEIGSLRLGFVSKLSDGDGPVSNKSSTQRARREDPSRLSGIDGDLNTIGSEEVTLDSALHTKDGNSTIGHIRTGNVQLSTKHSVALTDVTVLSQEPDMPVRFKGEDKMEHLRVISIQDVSGTSLLFLANNFREAELMVCGLKLLLERETTRLGVRGGLPHHAFGNRSFEGAMSPAAARGFRDMPQSASGGSPYRKKKGGRIPRSDASHASSTMPENKIAETDEHNLPDMRRAWGAVPGRSYMRGQAAALAEKGDNSKPIEQGVPQYAHGQQVIRELAKNVRLPLPLPLCRVLLLDSTSPVIKKWERDRGDHKFEKSNWAFPPATPRELEIHASEHQLIASGSMCGAHRTIAFDRPRYGSFVRLSETHTVDGDDSKKVVFTVTERNPRRGFSIKIRVTLRGLREDSCDANVIAEIRPVGKDMSNQAAVHKAFLLVIDEINLRYGLVGNGLLAGFLTVLDEMAQEMRGTDPNRGGSIPRPFSKTGPSFEEKKVDYHHPPKSPKTEGKRESGLVSFSDMLRTPRRDSPETTDSHRPSTPSLLHQIPEADPAKRLSGKLTVPVQQSLFEDDEDSDSQQEKKDPVLIEVKPLPKIRLSLMPSPREEDEDLSSSGSPVPSKPVRKKKSSRSRRSSTSSVKKSSKN